MIEANVIFTLDGENLTIQCSENNLMKDICQKYANKIQRNINSLFFLYGGNQLNFQKTFKDLVVDKERNEIKVLVYSKENEEFICPKCGEKIKINTEKIDDIIKSINNLKETIDNARLMIENTIKISAVNNINIQLKGVNMMLNILNEDLKKTKKKVENLLKNNENNYIIAEITIKEEDVNKKIRILNSYENCLRTNSKVKKEELFKNEDEIKKCEIKINEELIPFNYFLIFKSKVKHIIKYIFKHELKSTCLMFYECSFLTNINLSNFNTNNVKVMNSMFNECSSLIKINLSNFNTINVINMAGMFEGCSSLTNINLSNFNTNNVTNMNSMFNGCSSLTNINLSNFNTSNVTLQI